jgi:hypothetical protein
MTGEPRVAASGCSSEHSVRSPSMRLVRGLGLVATGVFAGLGSAGMLLRHAFPSRGDHESDELGLAAIFTGVELESHASAFRGGSMFTWFGGIAADLREATLAPEARLTLTTVFGGIAVRLPHGWRVESRLRATGGGVAIDVPDADEHAPLLVLDGVALFGGVAVRAGAPEEEGAAP